MRLLLDKAAAECTLHPRTLSFLGGSLGKPTAGRFRIRLKIHKNPPAPRPIANLGSAWIQPFAIWLCEVLAPIQDRCAYVTFSSRHLLEKLGELTRVPGEYSLLTIDIVNLYPSIEPQHMLEVVSTKIRYFYAARPAFALLAVRVFARHHCRAGSGAQGCVLACKEWHCHRASLRSFLSEHLFERHG